MHASQLRSPFARNPAAMAAPIQAKLEFRSIEAVFGPSRQQVVEWNAKRDANNLAAAETAYAYACQQLGVANRSRKPMRRLRVAAAFRYINERRSILRAARKALAASQIALAALATASA